MRPPNPQVHSMHEWNGTGIVLPATKHPKIVSITMDGNITWTANRRPEGGRYNARGWVGHPAHYERGYKCPGLNEGCLVVKIQKSGVFIQLAFSSPLVTENQGRINYTFDVPADIEGEINLGINDSMGNLGDNDGILEVTDISWKERL